LTESLPLALTLILMILAIIASVVPMVPGPALVWAIGLLYAAFTGFERVSVLAAVVMTALMLLGSTSGWWMQAAGMKAQGGSWVAVIGGLVGGLIGSLAIPVPILGTFIGVVAGTLLVELLRVGDAGEAARSGKIALKGYLLTLLTETGISVLIAIVFAIAAL
jgi:uncharacterized protein YqgC (DUF456 family)